MLMGSICGSATANVVGTGSFTIPLMKKIGYRPHEAASVETAASLGGIMTPPIMGSCAFLMAEWTGVSYIKIIAIAFLPAFLYYISVSSSVYIMACKLNLKEVPPEEIPSLKQVLKDSYLLAPIVVIIVALMMGYSPMHAGIWAIVSCILVSYVRKHTWMTPKKILCALEMGARSAILVSAAMACAGIIMGAIGLSGIGLKFSSIILSASGGNVFFAIVLCAIASLFLGMELPVTASYVVLAIIAVPALLKLGIPLLASHMIILWFSQSAAVTPPVCCTAYAAAGVANANPFKTGLTAWRLAKGLYILPFLFAYTPLITGSTGEKLITTFFAIIGLICLTFALERYLFHKLSILESILFAITGFFFFFPGMTYHILGGGLLLVGLSLQREFRTAIIKIINRKHT